MNQIENKLERLGLPKCRLTRGTHNIDVYHISDRKDLIPLRTFSTMQRLWYYRSIESRMVFAPSISSAARMLRVNAAPCLYGVPSVQRRRSSHALSTHVPCPPIFSRPAHKFRRNSRQGIFLRWTNQFQFKCATRNSNAHSWLFALSDPMSSIGEASSKLQVLHSGPIAVHIRKGKRNLIQSYPFSRWLDHSVSWSLRFSWTPLIPCNNRLNIFWRMQPTWAYQRGISMLVWSRKYRKIWFKLFQPAC